VAGRDRNKQGLIYGPVRPSGPRDRGRIVGNMLGLLVVVITAGVLGSAIYILLTQAPPAAPIATAAPTASPAVVASLIAGASTLPSPTIVAVGTIAPAAPPTTPGASIVPSTTPATPAPTLFVPPVQQGPGFITFGTTADSSFRVTDPKTTFSLVEPMVWSAYLLQAANASDLQVLIYTQDPTQASGQRLVRTDAVTPNVQSVRIFFHRARPTIGATFGAGFYTIQYVLGGQVLAQGSFLVQ